MQFNSKIFADYENHTPYSLVCLQWKIFTVLEIPDVIMCSVARGCFKPFYTLQFFGIMIIFLPKYALDTWCKLNTTSE